MPVNSYLRNPVLPNGFYNVKCLDVQVENGLGMPIIIACLKVVPYAPYGEAQNAELWVTLRDTPNAEGLHAKFRDTFRVEEDPSEAIGRFGCILVDAGTYEGAEYSAVHFTRQSEWSRQAAMRLEEDDRDGELPWDVTF